MKREIFITSVLGIIGLVIIGNIIINALPKLTTPSPTVQTNTTLIQLTDFSKHNNSSDCWIRMNTNVYNITLYLNQHPGGISTILSYCGGQDAADAFATSHSSRAQQLLQTFFIGTLASQ